MITKVVFFICWPLNERDYKRFGAEVLQRNGLEVLFFEFTPFLCPLVAQKAVITKPKTVKGHTVFQSKQEALKAISTLPKESFVVSLLPFNFQTLSIYRSISKARIPYAIPVSNAFPSEQYGVNDASRATLTGTLIRKVRGATPSKIIDFIKRFATQGKFAGYYGVKDPALWIAGGERSPGNYFSSYPYGDKTEMLWTHTLDYDIFLENKTTEIRSTRPPQKIVFIDVGAPKYLGDDLSAGRERSILTEERYYPSLCRFFEQVEHALDMTIEIAAHPRSNHASHPEYFDGRTTLHGQTFQLIRDAALIITHASTATNFAVLLNKPILLISTDEYEEHPQYYADIRKLASWLGKEPVNIDRPRLIDWAAELTVSEYHYQLYRKSFIKKDGTPDLNSWHIVADRLHKGF